MNFVEEYKKGQAGGNKGIPFGEGLEHLTHALNGIQMGRMFTIASSPKTGKTSYVVYAFLIQPYLHCIKYNIPIEWIWYLYEETRVALEFYVATYFIWRDFGRKDFITLDEGQTVKGKNTITFSTDYLRGRVLDDNNNLIKVKPEIEEALKIVYETRVIPLFGEYNNKGFQVKQGLVKVITETNNPTGIYKELMGEAEKRGTFQREQFGPATRIVGYKPHNPDAYVIVVQDHIRKCLRERGFTMKENIDKMSELFVIIRNLTNWVIVPIIHLNRSLADIERLKQFDDRIHPSPEAIKDSANLSEDSDYVITMFNPNDDRYNLKSHFGKKIRDENDNPLYPNLRTLHLVESRHCMYPQHFSVNMLGNVKAFQKFNQ